MADKSLPFLSKPELYTPADHYQFQKSRPVRTIRPPCPRAAQVVSSPSTIMGNKSSRPADDFAELVHKGKRRAQQPEQTYSKEKIEEGFKFVAKYLASKGLNVSIVTVGGAVNTVFLKSRASTSDVDFFYRTKDAGSKDINVMHEVAAAGKLAEKQLGLGEQWLNNHTVTFIEVQSLHEAGARLLI